jgi:hypothetical protein
MSSGAWRSKKAWAICERPALWLQTNSTYFIFLLSGGGQELVAVFSGQPRLGDLPCHPLGVVLDALDISADPSVSCR